MNKLELTAFTMPSARAASSGVGYNRSLMIVNKINEIIEAFGSLATTANISAINLQMQAYDATMATYQTQLQALADRVTKLEFPQQDAIADLPTNGIDVSILNLAAVVQLNNQQINQAKTINKLTALARTRKEIKT